MKCPNCSYKFLGKIGRKKYFCSNCYSELLFYSNECKVISLNEKGVAKVIQVCGVKE